MTPDWIRTRLAEAGRTQADLAAHLCVSEPTMSKIMSGARAIKALEADKIRAFFGIPADRDELTVEEARYLALLERLAPESRLLALSMLEALADPRPKD